MKTRPLLASLSLALLCTAPGSAQEEPVVPPSMEPASAGEEGAPPAEPDAEPDDEPELVVAARQGGSGKVASLLREGAEADAPGLLGRTALMLAASGGHPEIVRALLDAGAGPAATDDAGSNALFYFPPAGDPALARTLFAVAPAGACSGAPARLGRWRWPTGRPVSPRSPSR